jgi:hypothetical protein
MSATKPMLLRRVCQRLGLRIKAKSYDWHSAHPFVMGDVVDAHPVPKGCGGNGPPGWAAAANGWIGGGLVISVLQSLPKEAFAQSIFGRGNTHGPGGSSCTMVPCPLSDVEEYLALAQVQVANNQWASVYELAQQAHALANAICGPLHR